MLCLPGYAYPCRGKCIPPSASSDCLAPRDSGLEDQCSFPRDIAISACSRLKECHVITCHRSLNICQARRGLGRPIIGWSDQDTFAEPGVLHRLGYRHSNESACNSRHVATAAGSAQAFLAHTSRALKVACLPAAGGRWQCELQPHAQAQRHAHMLAWLLRYAMPNPFLAAFGRTDGLDTRNRSGIVAQIAPTVAQYQARLQRHPVLYAPVVEDDAVVREVEPGRIEDYIERYARDPFLQDAIAVYRAFFRGPLWDYRAPSDPRHPNRQHRRQQQPPFFIEVGGATGTVDGSNSWLFERLLGWRGLLAEAHPQAFAKLATHRPLAFRLNSALCNTTTSLMFDFAYGQVRARGHAGTGSKAPTWASARAGGVGRGERAAPHLVSKGSRWRCRPTRIDSLRHGCRPRMRARHRRDKIFQCD